MDTRPREKSKGFYKGTVLGGLDNLDISPNRLVTLRTGVGISVAVILAATENLGISLESGLMLLGATSLIADKTDGDLARETDQCSDDGEVLDAGADKVIVYTSLLFILLNLPDEISRNAQLFLTGAVGFSFILDLISQGLRGKEANINALKQYWKKPLTQEQRKENTTREKTDNASNIFGKLKTGAVMTAVGVGLEGVTPIDEETRIAAVSFLTSISVILGGSSLYKKIKKK